MKAPAKKAESTNQSDLAKSSGFLRLKRSSKVRRFVENLNYKNIDVDVYF